MKTRNTLYKNLQSRVGSDACYQIRVVKGGDTYYTDQIVSCDIEQTLCEAGVGVDIGQACASVCTLVLLESSSNWERMAKFTVSFRIVSGDASNYTNWYDIGQFYTDTRSEDVYGQLTITAYDGMLLMEKTWTDSIPSQDLPASWPITARAWATLIQQHNLASFQDLTQLDNQNAFVGLNTTSSIRDVLKSIATVHGGNWTMLANGKLSLIQYVNHVDEIPQDANSYIDLGQAVESVETSPALSAVTGVHLETDSGTVMEYGEDSGYVVRAVCNVSSTSGIAQLCYSKVEGFIYKPFTAYNVCIDPAIELGDSIKINNVGYQVMALDLRLNGLITATISAPYDQEVDHEYAVPNEDAKTYRKAMEAVQDGMIDYVTKEEHQSSLEQTESSITATVSATYVTQQIYNEQIAEIQSQLDGSIQTWSGNVVPTLNNAPAVDWTTAGDKAEHVGDTYFVNSDAGIPEAGTYYRFENNNGVYSWQPITDTALTEALTKAATAQAAAESAQTTANQANTTAQAKGRIFVVQPTPPYDKGDLWFNSTTSDIKVCMKEGGRQTGSFVDSDWVKRDKYTDDSALEQFKREDYAEDIEEIRDQLDKKAQTYYQDTDPALEWGAAIANIAKAGDIVGYWDASEHKGDLWLRSNDNTTWYFDGDDWVEQSVPDEVFDKIDGKAQIFIEEPYAPYHVGDLWFKSAEDDIKTCISQRLEPAGAFNEDDWVKYNKYTDDTAANQVDQNLTTFKNTFSINPQDIRAEVEKHVLSDHDETRTSFGWVLSDENHIWYATDEEVMKITRDGLYVKGEIRASTGYIGDDSSGFKIQATSISNGMTNLNDTTHNGIFISSGSTVNDGIALGKGNFKVTSRGVITAKSGTIGGFTINATSMYTNGQTDYGGDGNGIYMGSNGFRIGANFKVDNAGNINIKGGTITIKDSGGATAFSVSNVGAVTAKNLTLTGGSININNGKFKVDSSGNLTAENGTFGGTVKAKKILYDSKNGDNGVLPGSAIEPKTITGGTNGQIAPLTIQGGDGGNIKQNTLTDLNVVSSGYSPSALNSTIQGNLNAAANYAKAIISNTATYPAYFTAGTIMAKSGITSNGDILASNNTVQGKVVQGNTLKVYYGSSGTGGWKDIQKHTHNIEIADDGTITIKDADWTGANHPFNVADTKAFKDAVEAINVRSLGYTAWQFVSGDKNVSFASNYTDYNNGALRARGIITLDNGNTCYCRVSLSANKAQEAVTVTASDGGVSWNNSYKMYYYTGRATASNGETDSFTQYFNPTEAIEWGKSQGGSSYVNYVYSTSSSWTTRNSHPLCRVTTIVYGVTSGGEYVQLASGTDDYERPY